MGGASNARIDANTSMVCLVGRVPAAARGSVKNFISMHFHNSFGGVRGAGCPSIIENSLFSADFHCLFGWGRARAAPESLQTRRFLNIFIVCLMGWGALVA